MLWKTFCLVPVPKKVHPSSPNDYRSVALTSHLMKSLERLVLSLLLPLVSSSLDHLQFAYRQRLGVEDAITFLLHRAYAHLDRPGSTVRIMFMDFSSAFNNIRPALLGSKLTAMQVDPPLVSWITDYLTGRPQYVRLQDSVSDTVVSSTGAPQGTVLSPFLFTMYTSDFQFHSDSCHLQKFADDSAIVGCVGEGKEEEYRGIVESFIEWCAINHLHINSTKTKELVGDFHRRKSAPTPISINGVTVDVVQDYKYLGVYLDNKLDWAKNTEAVYKKCQSQLYFLRRLRSFNICNIMLKMFYQYVVASTIFFAVVCWGSSLRAADTNRISKIIRKTGPILGVQLEQKHLQQQTPFSNRLIPPPKV